MCDRLIQLSFAKIVNSKNERGGAKLRKNLLILRLLQQAKNELKYRQSSANYVVVDSTPMSNDKTETPTDINISDNSSSADVGNFETPSSSTVNLNSEEFVENQDENSQISTSADNDNGDSNWEQQSNIQINNAFPNNKRSIDAVDSDHQMGSKKPRLSQIAVYVGNFHYTSASPIVQFACPS